MVPGGKLSPINYTYRGIPFVQRTVSNVNVTSISAVSAEITRIGVENKNGEAETRRKA